MDAGAAAGLRRDVDKQACVLESSVGMGRPAKLEHKLFYCEYNYMKIQ